ncbi:hypothetical protein [Streptomyces justiciae]|uniref:hypothetical protein n=1 Tax=Streptomyces justiciae TaxID=2780140 RepID=UPI00211992B5|nr:hypothetical protein [Streptomyces justiciae]MCW8383971.1 hypothetical protein [Streptomyces justiciae]
MTDLNAQAARVQAAAESRLRQQAWREAEFTIETVAGDPEVQRLHTVIQEEELRLGRELAGRFQPFADRHEQAVRDHDGGVLGRICPGKHGQWGRICVLDERHDVTTGEPHWGRTAEGHPVAWLGTAPDND